MRIVKWVFGGLAAVVVILALAWVMVPKDRIINFALNQVEAQTGRDISVGGGANLKIFPNLVVVADQVSVANADWSDRGAMMSVDRLDVSVSLVAICDLTNRRNTRTVLIKPQKAWSRTTIFAWAFIKARSMS